METTIDDLLGPDEPPTIEDLLGPDDAPTIDELLGPEDGFKGPKPMGLGDMLSPPPDTIETMGRVVDTAVPIVGGLAAGYVAPGLLAATVPARIAAAVPGFVSAATGGVTGGVAARGVQNLASGRPALEGNTPGTLAGDALLGNLPRIAAATKPLAMGSKVAGVAIPAIAGGATATGADILSGRDPSIASFLTGGTFGGVAGALTPNAAAAPPRRPSLDPEGLGLTGRKAPEIAMQAPPEIPGIRLEPPAAVEAPTSGYAFRKAQLKSAADKLATGATNLRSPIRMLAKRGSLAAEAGAQGLDLQGHIDQRAGSQAVATMVDILGDLDANEQKQVRDLVRSWKGQPALPGTAGPVPEAAARGLTPNAYSEKVVERAVRLQRSFNEMADTLEAAGVSTQAPEGLRPFERKPGFFPKRYDLEPSDQSAIDRIFSTMREEHLAGSRKDPPTYEDAARRYLEAGRNTVGRFAQHESSPGKLPLPEKLPIDAAVEYAKDFGKQVGSSVAFGPIDKSGYGKNAMLILGALQREDPLAAKVFERAIDRIYKPQSLATTGDSAARLISRLAANAQLGYSPIRQWGQQSANVMRYGPTRVLRGRKDWLSDPDFRAAVEDSGAVDPQMAEYSGGGHLARHDPLSQWFDQEPLWAKGTNAIESQLRGRWNAGFKPYVEDLAERARGGKWNAANDFQAKELGLSRNDLMGITDAEGKLSNRSALMDLAQKAAEINQFTLRPGQIPDAMVSPVGRMVFQYKPFGIRQWQMTKDSIINPTVAGVKQMDPSLVGLGLGRAARFAGAQAVLGGSSSAVYNLAQGRDPLGTIGRDIAGQSLGMVGDVAAGAAEFGAGRQMSTQALPPSFTLLKRTVEELERGNPGRAAAVLAPAFDPSARAQYLTRPYLEYTKD